MKTEKIDLIRISIKNGEYPAFSYSNINEDASDGGIYNLAQEFFKLLPTPGEGESRKISKHIETSIIEPSIEEEPEGDE